MKSNNSSAKSKQQIAAEYGICTKTLTKWLKDENIILKRGLIRPNQLLLIYNTIGFPKDSK